MLELGLFLILGLVVGSFLNVVIHRLPLMMQFAAEHEAREILTLEATADSPTLVALLTAHSVYKRALLPASYPSVSDPTAVRCSASTPSRTH